MLMIGEAADNIIYKIIIPAQLVPVAYPLLSRWLIYYPVSSHFRRCWLVPAWRVVPVQPLLPTCLTDEYLKSGRASAV